MKTRLANGFTLPELLVVISLLAMIAVGLAGGLRIGARAWEKANIISSEDEAWIAARAIADRLEQTFPAQQRSSGSSSLAFIGAAHSCRFVTLNERNAFWAGLSTIKIKTEETNARLSLRAYAKTFRENQFNDPESSMHGVTLISGLSFIQFSYYGATDSSHTPQWRNKWQDSATLPDLVSVQIEIVRSDGIHQAYAVAALRQR